MIKQRIGKFEVFNLNFLIFGYFVSKSLELSSSN